MKFQKLVEVTQTLDSGQKSYKVSFYWGDKKNVINVKASSAPHAKHKAAYLYLKDHNLPAERSDISRMVFGKQHAMKAVEMPKETFAPTYTSPEISSYVQKSLPPGDL